MRQAELGWACGMFTITHTTNFFMLYILPTFPNSFFKNFFLFSLPVSLSISLSSFYSPLLAHFPSLYLSLPFSLFCSPSLFHTHSHTLSLCEYKHLTFKWCVRCLWALSVGVKWFMKSSFQPPFKWI